MYHPDQPPDQDQSAHEYVELYNPAGTSADVSGLTIDGVGLSLPSGTIINANSFLVCCASTNTIMNEYGISNVVGNWRGLLQNSGETISLRNTFGRELDRVTYTDQEPWPISADGYGPSLERRSESSPGSNSFNWSSSMAETNWQQVVWTGEISSANSGIRFFLDYDGKCWIDNVSVQQDGVPPELVTNGNFESGMNGWSTTGNHWRSRVEPGGGVGGSNALAVAGTFSRFVNALGPIHVVVTNGNANSNTVFSAPLATSNGESYVVSYWVRRDGLAGQLYSTAGNCTNVTDLSNKGTPGAANSVTGGPVGIEIDEVRHDQSIISTGVANTVRATIQPASGVASVKLYYRLVASNGYEFTDAHYTVLPMTNAGADLYSGVIPGVQTNRTLVRYHIRAVSTNGLAVESPRADDPSRDYGYWAESAPPQTTLPNWHILVDGTPILYPIAARGCVVSPDGQVFIDVTVRHRGGVPGDYESARRSGLGVRLHRGWDLDAWFASDQNGINFRHRRNSGEFQYRRLINEPLGYALQRMLGLATPRTRYVCTWINGDPTITVELEDPNEKFLTDHGFSVNDLLSRAARSGRKIKVDGNVSDNFYDVISELDVNTGATKNVTFQKHFQYESFRPALGLLSIVANEDQHFSWNMLQHRSATDGRWAEYPWDMDLGFVTNATMNPDTTSLHPYYQTPLHPDPNDPSATNGQQVTRSLFFPESGSNAEYTLPYRHRQQKTLWRYYHTIFTTNYLYPVLDDIVLTLRPAYQQIGYTTTLLSNQVDEVKAFIPIRRDFLLNGGWSDKDTNIWKIANVYDPTKVVINEIMADPILGGKYLEFYNTGTQTIDMSHWKLVSSDEEYHLPLGTMLGPTSFLVVADSQSALTDSFFELSDQSQMVRRYFSLPIWDHPIVWTAATEYETRIVQLPQITLSRTGSALALYDLRGTLIDAVTYSNLPPWTSASGISLELIDPSADNTNPAAWRLSTVIGTPGWRNSSNQDKDQDGMGDDFEDEIIAASGGTLTKLSEVLGVDDFDMDGMSNEDEFILGRNPTIHDSNEAFVDLQHTNGQAVVYIKTVPATGSSYQIYSGRYYTLQEAPGLTGSLWTNTPAITDILGNGSDLLHTNDTPDPLRFYRSRIQLKTVR